MVKKVVRLSLFVAIVGVICHCGQGQETSQLHQVAKPAISKRVEDILTTTEFEIPFIEDGKLVKQIFSIQWWPQSRPDFSEAILAQDASLGIALPMKFKKSRAPWHRVQDHVINIRFPVIQGEKLSQMEKMELFQQIQMLFSQIAAASEQNANHRIRVEQVDEFASLAVETLDKWTKVPSKTLKSRFARNLPRLLGQTVKGKVARLGAGSGALAAIVWVGRYGVRVWNDDQQTLLLDELPFEGDEMH